MSDRALEDPSAGSSIASDSAADLVGLQARARHMMGAEVSASWLGGEALAWEGLLEVARRLRRGAEEVLIEEFDLSISMLGIIGRLSVAPERTLRQTVLAKAMGLSLSRVSRVVDLLEQRGLIERRSCPADARASDVRLTRRGESLTVRAQASLFGYVQSQFLEQLEPDEVLVLGSVFARLLGAAPGYGGGTC